MARVIAVVNQKGGVGKTTTTINLGASLAFLGRRTLLVDADPQGNLTSGVGKRSDPADGQPRPNLYDALVTSTPTMDPESYVVATSIDGLRLFPADRQLTGAEIELVPLAHREERLRRLLDSLRQHYDEILIDCPPSLGLLTLNALVAADAVLIPLNCEFFALEGLAELIGTIRRVRGAFNADLDIDGVLFTMYDERTNLGQQVARDVRGFFGEKVFRTTIPRNVRLGEAPSHGLPALVYDPKSRGATAYVALAQEFLKRRAPGDLSGSSRDTEKR